ncbi:MAG: DUF1015 domain-containing protein [Chloroflexi bacterium]|nr:DUF1015 domain-containing protein [Chloroflexota bacterium]
MAEVRSFRALRYDPSRVPSPASVVCPPYDVIDPAEQGRLYEASPYNAVRIELGRFEPGDDEQHNRYTRAADALRRWQQAGVLRRDAEDALYVYEQTFHHRGQILTRRTIFAAVRLEDWQRRVVLPHERTMAAPKADRLRLLEATGVQLSPIYGLFEDPGHAVHRAFDRVALRQPPALDFVWSGDERQRLWVVTDRSVIGAFSAALSDRQIVIADGHHRYETALRYRDRRRLDGGGDADAPWNFILMGLTAVDDPGVVVLPTHRLVGGTPLPADELERGLAHWFDLESWLLAAEDPLADIHRLLDALAGLGRELHVFGLCERGERLSLARLRDPDVMDDMAGPGRSDAWKHLDVSIAQTLILQGALGMSPGAEGRLTYTRDEEVALSELRAGRAWLAIFLNPTRVDQVVAVARAGDVMPEKSTYFHPKLLTGLVFYPLD